MKFLIILMLILFSRIGFPQTLEDNTIQIVQKMVIEKMSKDRIPGLSIAIVQDNKLIWSEGFGFADIENEIKAKPNTAYRSASIGKPITASAIMMLVEEGKLNLNLPIQKYCPVFPQKKWPITTIHLLGHLSGIRHYGGPENLEELNSKKHYENVTDPLDIFKNDTLLFEPGTQRLYSTYGYNVLGCVLEGASGRNYMEFLQENIFLKAGMQNTQADNPYLIIPNRSSGYRISINNEVENCEYVDMSNKLPAGGFITTAEDLANFARAFMNKELVGINTIKEMLAPQKTADGITLPYGLGWALFPDEKWYGEMEAFHGGGSPGVSGILYLLPDRNFAVAILMNMEGVSERVDLAAQIAKEVLSLHN